MSDQDAERIYSRRRPVADPRAVEYLLPPGLGRRIFLQRIVPDLLAGPEPQARPVVVFLVGQHGAGKTRIAAMTAAALGRQGGFADLDRDLYKPLSPAVRTTTCGNTGSTRSSPRPRKITGAPPGT